MSEKLPVAYELQLSWTDKFSHTHQSQIREILVEQFKDEPSRDEQAMELAQTVGAKSYEMHLLTEEEQIRAANLSRPIVNQAFRDVSAKLISPGVKVRQRR